MVKWQLLSTSILFLLASCAASAELTRSRAKVIISAHTIFTTKYNEFPWVDHGYEDYLAQGGTHNPAFIQTLAGVGNFVARLNSSVVIHIDEITGIADVPFGQGIKEVHFRWSTSNVPDVLKPLVAAAGTGTAMMRLYDDGWRVEEPPSLAHDTNRRPLTLAQMEQIAAFKAKEVARLGDGAERLKAGTTPTQELYKTMIGDDVPVVVTDVNVKVSYPARPAHREKIWLSNTLSSGYDVPAQLAQEGKMYYGCLTGTLRVSESNVPFRSATGVASPRFQVYLSSDHQRWRDRGCGELQFDVPSEEIGRRILQEITKARSAWRERFPDLISTFAPQ